MVIQLYKAGFIPGNPGRRNKDLINKRQKKDPNAINGASPVAYPISIPKQGTTPGNSFCSFIAPVVTLCRMASMSKL